MALERRYRFHLLSPLLPDSGISQRSHCLWNAQCERLLGGAQKLRADCYLTDGAICISDVDDTGRFQMDGDEHAWHLLLVDTSEIVVGCVRFFVHREGATFDDLHIRRAAIFSTISGPELRLEIETEMTRAWGAGLVYTEIGGWAIADGWRKTKAALDMIAAAYALGELWGGALGICTATARHNSATILRKFGAAPFSIAGQLVEAYADPHYQCEMELLRFDRIPAQRFGPLVEPLKRELRATASLFSLARSLESYEIEIPEREVA